MLSRARADLLRPLLDGFLARSDPRDRLPNDPVELVHRYRERSDVEVAGLLCSSLAYGRVDLFKPQLERLLQWMGPSPARFCRRFGPGTELFALDEFVYRFNRGADIACLWAACGEALNEFGGLGQLFEDSLSRAGGDLRGGLQGFVGWLRGRDFGWIVERLGPPRALDHLLPRPEQGGACKRLNLYLRWMVRGPDPIDFGIWSTSPSRLVVPLDTHIARVAKNLGFTTRRDLSWKTAEEITGSLRLLDPNDPVKYDFALCHHGMSGACPSHRGALTCDPCGLRPGCGAGRRVMALARVRPPASVRVLSAPETR
jgi:uncharacterized protein (TIGR02757 family)